MRWQDCLSNMFVFREIEGRNTDISIDLQRPLSVKLSFFISTPSILMEIWTFIGSIHFVFYEIAEKVNLWCISGSENAWKWYSFQKSTGHLKLQREVYYRL